MFEVLRNGNGDITGVSILNKRAGRSTDELLSELEAGEVVSCLGPLGVPFTPVAAPMEGWMVAGGVGLAPFATLAESLAASRTPATLFYGARTAGELFYLDFFEGLGITPGAVDRGWRAIIKQTLHHRPRHRAARSGTEGASDLPGAMVYACGPEPMLEAVAKLAARYHQPSQVSVERVMGCGLGGYYSWSAVNHGDEEANLVRSCISGPVFDGAELVWE